MNDEYLRVQCGGCGLGHGAGTQSQSQPCRAAGDIFNRGDTGANENLSEVPNCWSGLKDGCQR